MTIDYLAVRVELMSQRDAIDAAIAGLTVLIGDTPAPASDLPFRFKPGPKTATRAVRRTDGRTDGRTEQESGQPRTKEPP